ncbi:hypothetical protein PDN49_29545 [Bacillus cereus]|uniref:Uncharacterized protein n=1 Tax=Bacillus thuringiensis TaxID=1428 RepID=A0A9W3VGY4_BACTU|nr:MULTISPECIES: hypothetical protein [Bacillus cereus group]AMR05990.1 hypothetical protein AXW78_28340 [Bacillus thuringiensis]AYF85402.1 hypothetical protein D7J84_31035 [Bacillus thuringiensis]MDA2331533.1 hypothetical protein [Bacillus cereus]MDA2337401.1 hypothetical protein [Bacillus cereus]MDA2358836.1 hypothetical protein [Bacillus cereus]
MAQDIMDELIKWQTQLEDELKTIEKVEKDDELQAYTLSRKIEILEIVSGTFEEERKESFENSRIAPLRISLESLEKEIERKKKRFEEKKEELQKTLKILQAQIKAEQPSV